MIDTPAVQPSDVPLKPGAAYPTHSHPVELSAAEMPSYQGETYYDFPSVKHSHYKWRTAVAFLFNGLAGGAQILSTIMDLTNGQTNRSVVRAGRYLAFGGGTASTVLLISALHTKQRWYNMLRIYKKTSPMSIGIWAITPFTILSGLAAGGQQLQDRGYEKAGRFIGRGIGLPAALLGSVVMTYMGTELEETNMPLWAGAYPLMAPLYGAMGISNATAALSLAAEANGASTGLKAGLNKLAKISGVAELTLSGAMQAIWGSKAESHNFRKTPYYWMTGCAMGTGVAVPLILRLLKGNNDVHRTENIAKLAGGLILQLLLIYGGRESGRHARDYFEYTRPPGVGKGNGAGRLPRSEPGDRKAAIRVADRGRMQKPLKRSNASAVGWGLMAVGAAWFISSATKKKGVSL